MKKLLSSCILLACITACSSTKPVTTENPSLSEWGRKTEDFVRKDGYIPYYWNPKTGKMYLEIDKFNQEMLYVTYLSAGVGSNDIGLDRGQIGNARIISFKKIGNKVLVFQPNYDYRATTANSQETKAVEDAFARSVLWGFTVEAEQDGSILVDATGFFLRDTHGMETSLKDSRQGSYRLDASRSALNMEGTRNFPKNTEIDVWLTFTGHAEGAEIRSVTPDADAVTVRQHHSFVELPDSQFKPRKFDIRSGYFETSYKDYGVPIDQDINQRLINRHRLEKKNPEAERSEAVKPIIYYLDGGVPEPVRSALLEGASWWNEAFEAAGFINAFQVKILPDSIDPLDIRYNVIQWVHRSSRGWSYGSTVTDPRTGEIIKGHVSLGSLRVRQDFMIATGLLAPYKDKNSDPRMLEMALARLRQLAAHEVGHTLGLAHNYAASITGRASVMDYPHPLIELDADGSIDLQNAYAKGIGEWDKVAIRYGYTEFEPGQNEAEGQNKILEDSYSRELRFISDYDARSPGGAHPYAHLWDEGADPVKELQRLMIVRAKALSRFGENVIRTGEPMTTLHDALVPVYFLHRYQSEAVAKMIGGAYYDYKLKGDNQKTVSIVDGTKQRSALNTLLETLRPDKLVLPESLLNQIAPRPIGYYDSRELIKGHTNPMFDPLAAADQYIQTTLSLLLNPERAARLIEYHGRNKQNPGLEEVLTTTGDYLLKPSFANGYEAAIQMTAQQRYVQELIRLTQSEESSVVVKAEATGYLDTSGERLSKLAAKATGEWKANYTAMHHEIRLFFENPAAYKTPPRSSMPPGSPIGVALECDW
jgi:Met-zincin/Domain of unknown function (DUF5117)